MSGFYAKVGSPVLTDISLDLGEMRTSQLYPTRLPDLFAGSQLIVAGRYRDEGLETITLRGTVNGREVVYAYEGQQFAGEGGEPFIPRLWATRAIGQMMQQIRLEGEDQELVQSIVNLSTRYGIITPYTSFLIEEEDIFAQTGDDLIMEAEEALAAPAAVSGAQAVDRAAMESEMFGAEAPAAMPTMAAKDGSFSDSQPVVKSAGSKTFFLRSGVWVDSAYDAAAGEAAAVPFASPAYFDLLADWPEAGAYLALGEELILVLGGEAYQIVAGAEEAAVSPTEPAAAAAIEEATEAPEAAGKPFVVPEEATAEPASGLTVCGAALAMPLLLLGGWGVNRGYRRKR